MSSVFWKLPGPDNLFLAIIPPPQEFLVTWLALTCSLPPLPLRLLNPSSLRHARVSTDLFTQPWGCEVYVVQLGGYSSGDWEMGV